MKNALRCAVLLVVVGLAAAPVWAAEMRLTGYIENSFPYFRSNVSGGSPGTDGDFDVTRNSDQTTMGRTRGRLYFNIIANEDLRGVAGFELDAVWGRNPDGAAFSFDRNTDMGGNLETKWLYVDFRVPQIPIGNRWTLGGIPLYATPLHGQAVLHGDVGGGTLLLNITDQVAAHFYYAQFEEDSAADSDRFVGNIQLGEDYATGMTLRLKPFDGLDVHLPFVYGHLHLPSTTMLSQSSPRKDIPDGFLNVATESRYYLGLDARWRLGNTSIEPTFMYLLGTRKFDNQPVTGFKDTSFNAFFGHINVSHALGPWLLQAKYAYASGNKANDDINNRGIGNREDIKYYTHMNADGGPFYQEWFEIFGNSEVDGTSIDTFTRMAESGGLDRFGWQVLAGAVEYKATDNLVLEGAVGGFWAAQKPACPAQLRVGSLTGRCGAAGNAEVNTASGDPIYNFTGDSRYLGFEAAAGARYTIMPGLTWTPRLAWADYGKGLNQNGRKALDAWVFVNRVVYIF